MHPSLLSWFLPLVLVLIRASSVYAACGYAYDWGEGGVCNSDPNASDLLQLFIYPDAGQCEDQITVTMSIIYVDTLGVSHTVAAVNNPQVGPSPSGATVSFDFAVPQSSILNGAVVTQIVAVTDLSANFGTATFSTSYTQTHVSTIVTNTITSTIPSVVTVTTVSTSTLEEVDTVTETPPLVISTSATGTKTVYTKPTVTISTVTLTPKPRTKTINVISTVTTTVSCIGKPNHRRSPVFGYLNRRQDSPVPTFSYPNCGPIVSNTIDSTTLIISTSTSTEIDTAFTTTTSVSTTTLPAPTSYSYIKTTKTITPTRTIYQWTTVKPVTTTTTKSYVVTKTVINGGKKWLPRCFTEPPYHPPHGDKPICPTKALKNQKRREKL